MNEFYEEADAKQILGLALKNDSKGGMTPAELRAAAAEMGVTEDALAAAEAQWLQDRKAQVDLREYHERRKRAFMSEISSYAGIVGGLAVLNWMTRPGHWWVQYVAIGWGLVLVAQAFETFNRNSPAYQKGFERWRRKRERKELREAGADSA